MQCLLRSFLSLIISCRLSIIFLTTSATRSVQIQSHTTGYMARSTSPTKRRRHAFYSHKYAHATEISAVFLLGLFFRSQWSKTSVIASLQELN